MMSPAEKHSLRMQAARDGKSGYITQKEQRRDGLKAVMKHGRRIKKHQEWLSKELGNTIENFNDLFINNLSLSLTQIFVDKDRKLEKQKEQEHLHEEDEEEEEETDEVFEVEVVNQKAEDEEKAEKVDRLERIGDHDEPEGDDEEEKDEPATEQHIQEAIHENEEAQTRDKKMQDQLHEQEKAVIKIEGSLQEREKLLEAVKESHKLMQNTLLEEMKKEYFKKVKEMEYEMEKLKSDHKLSLRGATSQENKNNMESQYKQKMAEFEQKLKLYKIKEKDQKKMEREVVKQSNKIRVLENDIEKMRSQKLTLGRKLKEYDEKYRKWKTSKGTELLQIKKLGMKKDRVISQLKRDNKRKEMQAQRNAAELKILKKKYRDEESNKRMEENRRRRRIGKKVKKKETKKVEKSPPLEFDKVRDWIEANVEKMVTIKHLQKDLASFKDTQKEIENEIEDEQKYFSEISIKKEKAMLKKAKLNMETQEGDALILEKDIEEYDAILNKNQENIEALEDKIEFYNKKIIDLESAIEEVNNEEIHGLNLDKVDSVQNAKTLLVAFFNIVLEVKVQKLDLEDTLIDQHNSINDLEKEIKILRESKRSMEIEFNRALQKREKEYEELESKLMQETEAKINETQIQMSTDAGLTSLEAKRLEKKKNEKNFSTEAYEDSKRKLSKMMSELERRLVVEEKKNLVMVNMVDQSKAEKEQYKQKYLNLRKKMKEDEWNQIRMNKMGPIDTSNYGLQSNSDNSPNPNKLTDYKDMRKDRKIVKKGGYNDPGVSNPNLNDYSANESSSMKDRRSGMMKMRQAVSLEQSNSNVFDRLTAQSTITSRIKEKPHIGAGEDGTPQSSKGRSESFSAELERLNSSELLWNCDYSIENAHNGPIYSIATFGNQLYTCSKRSLKIWDTDTMTWISDIAAHSGTIKSLCVIPDQKLLATACDKIIMLWDLVSLINVATLKAHQEDINMLQRGNNILVSGGVSGYNNPALYVWDLRSSNPIEEREKSDIQWIQVVDDDRGVFIGNSAQLVKYIEFDSGPSEALSPPHNDVVTSLTMYRGVLVSASRDKSLRFWERNEKVLMHTASDAHKNSITCLDSDEYYIYSGWKDNIVKAWQFKELSKDQIEEQKNQEAGDKENKLEELEEKYGRYKADVCSYMLGHSSQINSIWALNDENNSIFTGGNDKSLKLWRK